MTNFGASFKKARESKGISLVQIAGETRISTRFLAAIENEEFHLLPGGIFNRGFVRTFAEIVGLDPDQAVADYARVAEVREPNDALASASARPGKGERHLYSAAVGILALAIAIFYVATREPGPSTQTASPPPAIEHSVVQPAPLTAPPETTPAASTITERQPQPPANPHGLTLDIEAREKTWIKVSSDGTSVNPGEILQPGMTRKFTAQSSIYISIGNAAGLALKINDIPLKPLGKSGEVRSVTITTDNLKDLIG